MARDHVCFYFEVPDVVFIVQSCRAQIAHQLVELSTNALIWKKLRVGCKSVQKKKNVCTSFSSVCEGNYEKT